MVSEGRLALLISYPAGATDTRVQSHAVVVIAIEGTGRVAVQSLRRLTYSAVRPRYIMSHNEGANLSPVDS